MTALVDEIHLHREPNQDSSSSRQQYLIFFITGNPGLISYYDVFLNHLYALVCANDSLKDGDFEVYGRSLSGFEIKDELSYSDDGPPYSLEAQIENVERNLESFLQKATSAETQHSSKPKVILVGHSVGTYIIFEILRRRQEHNTSLENRANGHSPPFEILGGILLFPTVMDLSSSSHGQKFDVRQKISILSNPSIPVAVWLD